MICLGCGTANADDNRFCGHCGRPLTALPPAHPAAGPMPPRDTGERRNLVLMFADIADSTAISLRLDPEEWQALLAGYYRTIDAAVDRFGGHVAKHLGDGILAYFGWPTAHENDAERAARASLAILDEMAQSNARAQRADQPALGVRIAIHAGEVVVTPAGDVFGDAPNVAAHVQAAAARDSIVATQAVARSIRRRLAVTDLGAQAVKGFEQPLRLFRVQTPHRLERPVGALPTRAPFVGRSHSINVLLQHWAAARDGNGQVVTVTGEPGIGKSRLVEEFHARIADQPHIWLALGGVEFAENSPFHPVARLLERLVRPAAPRERVIARLQRLLTRAGLDAPTALPPIAQMLGVKHDGGLASSTDSPGESRKALLQALGAWTLGAVRRRPAVIVVEDLHWVDPSTLELIEATASALRATSVLLILTARSPLQSTWLAPLQPTSIALERLSTDDIRQIVLGAAPRLSQRPDMIETIATRAGGVPLFAEELTLLVETGPPEAGAHGIPETLAGSFNARLDRLGSARETAQVAAVVGEEFAPDLLAAVAARHEQDLRVHLGRLVDADILVVTGTAATPAFRFRHGLIRDAAYGSLLRSRRRDLHERIATTIAAMFHSLAQTRPEVIARHLAAAGAHAPAVTAWDRAGHVFAERGAYREAEEAYQQALTHLAALTEAPDRDAVHLRLQNALVGILQLTRGYAASSTTQAAALARQLSERAGNLEDSMSQIAADWAAASSAGRYVDARALADRFVGLAMSKGSRDSRAHAHMIQMTSLYRLGDLDAAERHFELGRPLFTDSRFAGRPGAVAQTFGNAARIAWMMGRPDEGRRRMQLAVELAQASGRPYDIAFAQYMAAILAVLLREAESARDLAQQSIALSDTHGVPQFAAISRIALGRAQAALGHAAEGIALIRQGIAGMATTGSRVAITLYLAWLAEAQAAAGTTGAAMESIEQAFSANPEELFFRPELLRLRGELRAAVGETGRAEDDIRAALALATATKARWLQLRAAMSLHHLLQRDGGGAADIVDEIYLRIDEGRHTADALAAAEIVRRAHGNRRR
ncbi:MAG TPA: AAA family ATPase [Vineibacter sp.]|nr:AAA family ATPase [Vineibacter sp.]